MKLAISFSKLRLETDEIKLTLKNRFWQLCLLTNNYSTILHFFGNMIFQSIFHAIIALVKYVFLTGLYKLLHPAIPKGKHGASLENMENKENVENMEKMENINQVT